MKHLLNLPYWLAPSQEGRRFMHRRGGLMIGPCGHKLEQNDDGRWYCPWECEERKILNEDDEYVLPEEEWDE